MQRGKAEVIGQEEEQHENFMQRTKSGAVRWLGLEKLGNL
jgi:hypothetical protein